MNGSNLMEELLPILSLILVAAIIFGLCWFFGKFISNLDATKADKEIKGFTIRQWRQFGFVLVLGLCGIFVHFLMGYDLKFFNSAALYIGLPFLLALGMCFIPRTTTHVGATLKGLTIAILLAFPVLNEGVICMVMASPILYGIGILTAWSRDRYERKQKGSKIQLAMVATILSLASFEGVHDITTFPRDNMVEYSRIINAPIEDIRQKLASTPDITETRPFYMHLFPLPVHMNGAGLNIGDERKLDYVYKKWIWTNEKRGSTIFTIAENTDTYIRFEIPYDKSYLATYLKWQSSEILLHPVSDNATKVTWRLSYTRKLDPVWYFGPMQHHYVTQTAKALIDNVADPTL